MVGCMDRLCGIHVVKITTAIVRSFIWPMELFLMMVHTTYTHMTHGDVGVSLVLPSKTKITRIFQLAPVFCCRRRRRLFYFV